MKLNQVAEQALIGAVLVDAKKVVPKLLDEITPEMFSAEVLGDIYTQLLSQFGILGRVDHAPIIDNLGRDYDRGDLRVILADAMGTMTSIKNLPLYIESVQQHHKLRVLEDLGNKLALGQMRVEDVDGIMDEMAAEIGQLQRKTTKKKLISLMDVTIKNYQLLFDKESLKDSVITGFKSIDRLQNYLRPSNLIILAARPGVGKSAMAASLAVNIAAQGKKTAFYSMEMSQFEIYERLIANKAQLNLGVIQNREISDLRAGDVATAAGTLAKMDLYINDSGYQTVERIRTEVQLKGIQVVIVDYIQLISSVKKTNNRNDEVGAITRGLKLLAQDLNVIVIALSQLNRERDEYQEPSLSSLRDSGSIEQDANIVWFMWLNGQPDDRQVSTDIAFKISKNRNGKTGSCVLEYIGGVMSFTDTDREVIKATTKRQMPWEK